MATTLALLSSLSPFIFRRIPPHMSMMNRSKMLASTIKLSSSPSPSSSLVSIRPIMNNLLHHFSTSSDNEHALSIMNSTEEEEDLPLPCYNADDRWHIWDWHIVMEPPQGNLAKAEIIEFYVKTLARNLACEEYLDDDVKSLAWDDYVDYVRGRLYRVSTKYYYAFSADVCAQTAYNMSKLPEVRAVMCDKSYIDKSCQYFFGEVFHFKDDINDFADNNNFDYEPHKKMLLQGNYNMWAFLNHNIVCPPHLRGFFPNVLELEEWHVVMDPPSYEEDGVNRNELVKGYVKTLTNVISQDKEEAIKRIRSVSAGAYNAFGAYLTWKEAYKMNKLPHVLTVLSAESTCFRADFYLDVRDDPSKLYDYSSDDDNEPIKYSWDRDGESSYARHAKSPCPETHRGISLDAHDLKRRYDVLEQESEEKPCSIPGEYCYAFGGLMWSRAKLRH